jgi:hypothetical protein
MRFLSTILILLVSIPANSQDWSGISKCGIYLVNGIVRTTPKGHVIVVNEKSQSEFTITVSIPNEAKLAPYLDKAMVAKVALVKKSLLGEVKEISSRIPNPLSPQDTGVKLLTQIKCQE